MGHETLHRAGALVSALPVQLAFGDPGAGDLPVPLVDLNSLAPGRHHRRGGIRSHQSDYFSPGTYPRSEAKELTGAVAERAGAARRFGVRWQRAAHDGALALP